ncbi:hypothetical protein N7520_009071 [Penicillium odoratum]|uniref:uncharacterized protein n=1 Tax=Penicillium odoratum TaxID=1167516 RepID=UPI0025476EF7|nr:uncharacterized protein N7520_009071 [Penicillium odoratum]KAJ5752154.1 hypothetical protein N7520_009071 [Penicillium odoratum]
MNHFDMHVSKPLRILPSLSSITYYDPRIDQLPVNPVLGVLRFNFNPGIDISERCRASILWHKSLTYVSTIPGFQRLYWAPVDHVSSSQQIIILVQWDSSRGWKLFQESLGFSMMLGYIESISNRCIQLALPANLLSLDTVLELVSFEFPGNTQVNMGPGFKSKWETLLD